MSKRGFLIGAGITVLLVIAVATAIVGYHRSTSRQRDRGASPPESSMSLQDQEDAYMRSLVVDAPEGVTIRVDGNPRSPHARDRWIAMRPPVVPLPPGPPGR